jgi:hypothetical protein
MKIFILILSFLLSVSNSLYADMMREERVKNVIAQLNPDILLEDIEHRIRGEIKDRYTQEWKPIAKNKKPVSDIFMKKMLRLGRLQLDGPDLLDERNDNFVNENNEYCFYWRNKYLSFYLSF